MISDNGPQFSSDEFARFSTEWMFNHVTTSPYWPRANGMVESSVKIAKSLIRTAIASGQDPWLAILTFRNTPTQGMSTSPVQRLMSRRTKTLLPSTTVQLMPDSSMHMKDCEDRRRKIESQERHYNKTSKPLETLNTGDKVWVKPHVLGQRKWENGTVTEKCTEPRSYKVETKSGSIIRRNRNDLKKESNAVADQLYAQSDEEEVQESNEGEELSTQGNNEESTRDFYMTRYGRTKPPKRFGWT